MYGFNMSPCPFVPSSKWATWQLEQVTNEGADGTRNHRLLRTATFLLCLRHRPAGDFNFHLYTGLNRRRKGFECPCGPSPWELSQRRGMFGEHDDEHRNGSGSAGAPGSAC